MDLHGWDVVSALTVDQVNGALAKVTDDTLTVFTYSSPPALIAGRYGPWRLETGGSGHYVKLTIPIVAGVLQGMGPNAALDGLVAHVEVPLALVPSGPAQTDLALHFGTQVDGTTKPDPALGEFTIDGIDDPAGHLTALQLRGVEKLLATGLASKSTQIGRIFARIGGSAAVAGFPQIAATAFSYTDQPGPVPGGPPTGYLVVLGSIDAANGASLDVEFDPGLLGDGPAAAIAMSGALVLRQLLLPSLPAAVGHGASAGSFVWNGDVPSITANLNAGLDSVKSGLITYYPNLTGLSITIAGPQLQMVATGNCDLYLGLGMTWEMRMTDALRWNAGASTAQFVALGDPAMSYKMTGLGEAGMNLPITWILKAITQGIQAAVASSITSVLATTLGGMQLGSTPPIPIRWMGVATLHVSSVVLDDSLRITASA